MVMMVMMGTWSLFFFQLSVFSCIISSSDVINLKISLCFFLNIKIVIIYDFELNYENILHARNILNIWIYTLPRVLIYWNTSLLYGLYLLIFVLSEFFWLNQFTDITVSSFRDFENTLMYSQLAPLILSFLLFSVRSSRHRVDCGWIWKPVSDVTRSRIVRFRFRRFTTLEDAIDRDYSLDEFCLPLFLRFDASGNIIISTIF